MKSAVNMIFLSINNKKFRKVLVLFDINGIITEFYGNNGRICGERFLSTLNSGGYAE